MAKGNVLGILGKTLTDPFRPSFYKDFASKKTWSSPGSVVRQFADPNHSLTDALFPKSTKPKPVAPVDEQAAEARDLERRRLSTGASQRAAAIGSVSANLGKSTLGGGY